MNTVYFTPTYRSDGSIDPDCFEKAGQHWLKGWIADRLEGRDQYFPIDDRFGEDPDRLVVAILTQSGLAHPAARLIGSAILSLIDDARRQAPSFPKSFPLLLRICQQTRIPATTSWFTEELQHLAQGLNERKEYWGEAGIIKELLFAAIMQAPGLPCTASELHWLRLLSVPETSTLALLGLGSTFEQRALYLARWWYNCPSYSQKMELSQLVRTALLNEGETRMRRALLKEAASLQPDLQVEIDDLLAGYRLQPVFALAATATAQNPPPTRPPLRLVRNNSGMLVASLRR